MTPVYFPEANSTLSGGPASKYGTDEDVLDLHVLKDRGMIISCWKASWKERLQILLSGRCWLFVWAEKTHAPVALSGECPFERPVGADR